MGLVYYTADVAEVIAGAASVPDGVRIRSLGRPDIPALAKLYLAAYDPPVVATLAAASAEMTSAFDGQWGEFWGAASLGAWTDGGLACVVQTVRRPCWDAAPDMPWLIEVFTPGGRKAYRLGPRVGGHGVPCAPRAGEARLGLTVEEDNGPALSLYRSMGFARM